VSPVLEVEAGIAGDLSKARGGVAVDAQGLGCAAIHFTKRNRQNEPAWVPSTASSFDDLGRGVPDSVMVITWFRGHGLLAVQ